MHWGCIGAEIKAPRINRFRCWWCWNMSVSPLPAKHAGGPYPKSEWTPQANFNRNPYTTPGARLDVIAFPVYDCAHGIRLSAPSCFRPRLRSRAADAPALTGGVLRPSFTGCVTRADLPRVNIVPAPAAGPFPLQQHPKFYQPASGPVFLCSEVFSCHPNVPPPFRNSSCG